MSAIKINYNYDKSFTPISDQLRQQGLNFDKGTVGTLEKDLASLNRLFQNGYLTFKVYRASQKELQTRLERHINNKNNHTEQ
jgi:hypothetical protein